MNEFLDWLYGWNLPEHAASNFAAEHDNTFYLIYAVSTIWFFIITGITVYFCIKYRRRENDETPPHITHVSGIA